MRSHGHTEKNQKNKRHLRLLYFPFGFSAGQKKSLSRLSFFPLHQIFNITSFIHLLSIFFSLFTGFLYTVISPLYSLFPLFHLFDLIHPPDLGRTLYSYSFVSRELGLRSSCKRKGPLSSLVAKSTLVASVVTRPHTKSALKRVFSSYYRILQLGGETQDLLSFPSFLRTTIWLATALVLPVDATRHNSLGAWSPWKS